MGSAPRGEVPDVPEITSVAATIEHPCADPAGVVVSARDIDLDQQRQELNLAHLEGDLTGWSNGSSGCCGNSFYVVPNNGGTLPVGGLGTQVDPNTANYFAVSDQFGPGTEILTQGFTVAPGTTDVSLSFDWFNAAYYSQFGSTLDASDETMTADILTGAASPSDTGAGVVEKLSPAAREPSQHELVVKLIARSDRIEVSVCSIQELGERVVRAGCLDRRSEARNPIPAAVFLNTSHKWRKLLIAPNYAFVSCRVGRHEPAMR